MMMNHSFQRCLGLASLLGSLALAFPALAQEVPAAEALFNRGLAKMETGRYATGCPAIAESYRLDPRAGTLFTLSQCEVRWGRVATAIKHLGDYLQLYEHMTPEQQARQSDRYTMARGQLNNLAPEVPQLILSLPPDAPAGTVVKCDDAVVVGATLKTTLPVDPGEHVVSTWAPGGVLKEYRITIAKGEMKRLKLEVKAAPTGEVTPTRATPANEAMPEAAKQALQPPEEAGPSNRRIAAYVVGGVGIAGLVLGGVMGGLALGKKAIITENCGAGIDPKNPNDAQACTPAGLVAASDVKPLGLVSTIGFAAGIAGVGTAVVLILTEPKKTQPVTGARGPWIAASLLSAGPSGALVGAHGAF